MKRDYHINFDWQQMKFIGIDYKTDIMPWESLYPEIDIIQELKNMAIWLDKNRENGKSKKKNWRKFITGWLSRAQQKAVGL
jgi:hypothetical protein